jgi:hypothetical protein
MTTVPQPYVYPVSGIPGGQFGGQQSSHLAFIISQNLPNDTNPTISCDGSSVTITFDQDISVADKAILDALVARSADYFIVTTDGGVTDLGNPATIAVPAGLNSSTTITLQFKKGDGTNSNGYGDSVVIHAPIMTIDSLGGVFGANGQFQFTIGSELNRGEVDITISSDTLPERDIVARWT